MGGSTNFQDHHVYQPKDQVPPRGNFERWGKKVLRKIQPKLILCFQIILSHCYRLFRYLTLLILVAVLSVQKFIPLARKEPTDL